MVAMETISHVNKKWTVKIGINCINAFYDPRGRASHMKGVRMLIRKREFRDWSINEGGGGGGHLEKWRC